MSEVYRITEEPQWNKIFNLMLDPKVSEIEANGPSSFYMKRSGKRLKINVEYPDAKSYTEGIERGLIPLMETHQKYIPNDYLHEGPLRFRANGQKIQARSFIMLPPEVEYPYITLAKKSASLVDLDSIAAQGSMPLELLEFVKFAVANNLTIAISGQTGAGKTTMLEALTKLMPMDVRIGVLEDTPELILKQDNVLYASSEPRKPSKPESESATLDWITALAMRARIDKMIVGETRGKEFAAFLTAANSGMEGSLTTIHANSPRKALEKMSGFAQLGRPGQGTRAINKEIASSIDVIIQLIILPDGRHKVAAIEEITDTVSTNDSADITTQTLYSYDRSSDTWKKGMHVSDGLREKINERGGDHSGLFKSSPGATFTPMTTDDGAEVASAPRQARGLPTMPRSI